MDVALITARALLLVLALVAVAVMVWRDTRRAREIKKMREGVEELRNSARRRKRFAVESSRRTHVGKITEQLAPLLPTFRAALMG
jgi:predicted Holliday junction resolvase-like endonuclease